MVDPFLFGPAGRDTDDASNLLAYFADHPSVGLHDTFSDVEVPDNEPSLALIATRTADMPAVFRDVIQAGFKNIYLEKPGASTVEELEEMRELAAVAGVNVAMGYNKNVAEYVTEARLFAASRPGSDTKFIHMNAVPHTDADLGECFERNSEGMLKNQMIHELTLMSTFYGVTVDTIASVEALDVVYHEKIGPSGASYRDFSRVGFTVVTKDGQRISAQGDRCAGNYSSAEVSLGGAIALETRVPSESHSLVMDRLESEAPGCAPYFFLQDPEYIVLKERFAAHILEV